MCRKTRAFISPNALIKSRMQQASPTNLFLALLEQLEAPLRGRTRSHLGTQDSEFVAHRKKITYPVVTDLVSAYLSFMEESLTAENPTTSFWKIMFAAGGGKCAFQDQMRFSEEAQLILKLPRARPTSFSGWRGALSTLQLTLYGIFQSRATPFFEDAAQINLVEKLRAALSDGEALPPLEQTKKFGSKLLSSGLGTAFATYFSLVVHAVSQCIPVSPTQTGSSEITFASVLPSIRALTRRLAASHISIQTYLAVQIPLRPQQVTIENSPFALRTEPDQSYSLVLTTAGATRLLTNWNTQEEVEPALGCPALRAKTALGSSVFERMVGMSEECVRQLLR